MNIGIVVYSWSGHTQSVAEKLREGLVAKGHAAAILPVKVAGERKQGAREFELGALPDLSPYDAFVLGAAVEAFSLSPVLSAYLKRIDPLNGRKVACLVSQRFPYAWLGGNRAIRQMKRLLKAKDATIVGSAVVQWAESKRETSTASAVDRLSGLF
jgi:hypothetical protein